MNRVRTASLLVAGAILTAPGATDAEVISLSGSGATGFLSLSNVNNESVEPNTPGGKDFDYPYYYDPAQDLWVVIVAEPLSAGSTYAEELDGFTVLNKTVTDTDFGITDIGAISYDATDVAATGTTVLAPGQFTLQLDATGFSPLGTPRNVNNEFAWDYTIEASNLVGPGLAFRDGVLTSIDLVADVTVFVNFLGNPNPPFRFSPGYFEAGGLTFSGNRFAFDVDVTQDVQSVLGSLSDTRLVLNRSGTIAAVVPEPSTSVLIALGAAVLVPACRRVGRGDRVAPRGPGRNRS
jgi:hypothetical protein